MLQFFGFPRTGATSQYIKQHLTPFGEYIPLRTLAEFVSPYAKNVTDFRQEMKP